MYDGNSKTLVFIILFLAPVREPFLIAVTKIRRRSRRPGGLGRIRLWIKPVGNAVAFSIRNCPSDLSYPSGKRGQKRNLNIFPSLYCRKTRLLRRKKKFTRVIRPWVIFVSKKARLEGRF